MKLCLFGVDLGLSVTDRCAETCQHAVFVGPLRSARDGVPCVVCSVDRRGSRIFCRGGQRRPCTAGAFGARADWGSRFDKHQIKVMIKIFVFAIV